MCPCTPLYALIPLYALVPAYTGAISLQYLDDAPAATTGDGYMDGANGSIANPDYTNVLTKWGANSLQARLAKQKEEEREEVRGGWRVAVPST